MRISLLAFLSLASAAPLMEARQDIPDYGYWLATWRSEGFASGSTVEVVGNYFNLEHQVSIAINCRTTSYRGSETTDCTPGFSYSFGAPWCK